jgi:hypothetical protein
MASSSVSSTMVVVGLDICPMEALTVDFKSVIELTDKQFY